MDVKKGYNFPEIDRVQDTTIVFTDEELLEIYKAPSAEAAKVIAISKGIGLARSIDPTDPNNPSDAEVIDALRQLQSVVIATGEVAHVWRAAEGFCAARTYDDAVGTVKRLEDNYGELIKKEGEA